MLDDLRRKKNAQISLKFPGNRFSRVCLGELICILETPNPRLRNGRDQRVTLSMPLNRFQIVHLIYCSLSITFMLEVTHMHLYTRK